MKKFFLFLLFAMFTFISFANSPPDPGLKDDVKKSYEILSITQNIEVISIFENVNFRSAELLFLRQTMTGTYIDSEPVFYLNKDFRNLEKYYTQVKKSQDIKNNLKNIDISKYLSYIYIHSYFNFVG